MNLMGLVFLAACTGNMGAAGNINTEECLPACGDRICGDDGCGGSCGSCTTPLTCRNDGRCIVASGTCTPSCYNRFCGSDGCGGTCGECSSGDTCNTIPLWSHPSFHMQLCEPASYATSAMCPPSEASQGTDAGSIVPNTQLVDCDSHAVNLRGLCTNAVSIVYQINVDCAPCIDYVNTVLGGLKDEFGDAVDIYVVFDGLTECSTRSFFTHRDDMNFLVQGTFALTYIFGTGGKDSTLVMYEGNRIVSYSKKPTEEELRAAIMAATP